MRGFEANLAGPLYDFGGYPTYFRELASRLRKMGRVTIQGLQPPPAGMPPDIPWPTWTSPPDIYSPTLIVAAPHAFLQTKPNMIQQARVHAYVWLTMWEVLFNDRAIDYFINDIPWRGLLTTSHFCADQLAGKTDRPVFVVPNHANTDIFRLSARKARSGPFTFGMAGTFITRKGWRVLREAWLRSDLGPDGCRLLVRPTFETHGRANMRDVERLFEGMEGVEIWSNVDPLSQNPLLDFYNSVDCMVYPAFGDTLPKAILEPGALGLPTLGNNVAGIAELLDSLPHGGTFRVHTENFEACPEEDPLAQMHELWHWHHWWPSDPENFAEAMVDIANIGRERMDEVGREWSRAITLNYSVKNAALALKAAWKEIFDDEA